MQKVRRLHSIFILARCQVSFSGVSTKHASVVIVDNFRGLGNYVISALKANMDKRQVLVPMHNLKPRIFWAAACRGVADCVKDKIEKICPSIKIDRVESEIVKFFDIIILLHNRFPQRHGRRYGMGCRNGRQSGWLCGRCGSKAKVAYLGGNGYD